MPPALSQWSVRSSLRTRGLSKIWRENRQFADLFALRVAPQVDGVIHHPNLGNDFADQLSMTEKSHYGTLRNHNTDRFGNRTDVGGGNMAATKSQRNIHLCGHGVEIATRGKKNPGVTYHEPTIQLRQFLNRSPEIEIRKIPRRLGMAR